MSIDFIYQPTISFIYLDVYIVFYFLLFFFFLLNKFAKNDEVLLICDDYDFDYAYDYDYFYYVIEIYVLLIAYDVVLSVVDELAIDDVVLAIGVEILIVISKTIYDEFPPHILEL